MNSPTEKPRAYGKVRLLVAAYDGTMTWHPMGSGGDWKIALNGTVKEVACRDRRVNMLDHLYEPRVGVTAPATWADYKENALLKVNASAMLMALFANPTSSAGRACGITRAAADKELR